MQPPLLDAPTAGRFARLALDAVHRRYPAQISHVLQSDSDARAPWQLTPAFFGCYDWHSAVHGHWMLARLVRCFPEAPFAAEARAALRTSLTPEHLEAELAYLRGPGRAGFERPYGLAWLLTLCAELHGHEHAELPALGTHLEPLEREAAERLQTWLLKIPAPVRTGEHNQSAFSCGLLLDWAAVRGDAATNANLRARALELHGQDRGWKLAFEPSAHDFLSIGLATADLLRRLLEPLKFAAWLQEYLPELPRDPGAGWLTPAVSPDPSDGKLAHLDGLNTSRAWMLRGIAQGLPGDDPRRPALLASATEHATAGLAAVTDQHYAGSHWLGTFAVVWLAGVRT